MSFFNKIKQVFGITPEPGDEFSQVLGQAHDEYFAMHQYYQVNVSETNTWKNVVKNWPDKKKVAFLVWILQFIHQNRFQSYGEKSYRLSTAAQSFLITLLRNKLVLDEEDILLLYAGFSENKTYKYADFTDWPVALLLVQIERQYSGKVTDPLTSTLQAIRDKLQASPSPNQEKEKLKMIARLDALINSHAGEASDDLPVKLLGEDRLADHINPQLAAMYEPERRYWTQLLKLAQTASGSKPSSKYLEQSKKLISELKPEKFKTTVHVWFQFLVDLKEREVTVEHGEGDHRYQVRTVEYISSINAEAMKGLIWACANFHDSATIQLIAALAERSFKKIPGHGAPAVSLGNACLYTLYRSKGLEGIGQLSRLKSRIKQANTLGLIEKYLDESATAQGVTIDEVEDMAVSDFGISEGKREFLFDDHRAELVITGVGKTVVNWFKPDGSAQKSVPAAIKESHAPKLKKLKDTAKQVELSLSGNRDRLDRMFRSERLIAWDHFKKYYLDHGLMLWLTGRIIWNLHDDKNAEPAFVHDNNWVRADGSVIMPLNGNSRNITGVSLWHPIQSSIPGIKAWRDFLNERKIQQPLKQAYREVYILTEAELTTRTYSNRMAAHILRQHQFNSLARNRGWKNILMGGFDSGGGQCTLHLPKYQLRAEFWVGDVDSAMTESGIYTYVSTDQVRFFKTESKEPLPLIEVPHMIFTEVMRDCDLFVGVASIGNDPDWTDSGQDDRFRTYWARFAFDDLSEMAKNRKEILARLLPRLKIAPIAELRDKFLVVKGKLRTYKIHIGSTNILMEPNDQYLCIVPDRSDKDRTEGVFLPFEGDNGLSIILSKAFLLADDDKITDSTILSQINRN